MRITRRQALAGLAATTVASASVGQIIVNGSSVVSSSGSVLALPSGLAPLVLATDFLDVPTGAAPSATYIPSGMSAANYQGESGAGGFLVIALTNPGSQANLGTSSGARVYIGGAEVANYRYLVQAPCAVAARAAGWPFPDIWLIGVQIGSTAVQALTIGTQAALSVVVNGVASNSNDLRGNALNITPIQAPIIFVNEASGSDSNAGTFSAPVQHLQTGFSGANMTGVMASQTSVSGGKSNGAQAGTQYVVRSGTWSSATVGPNTTSWVQGQRVSGCAASHTITGGIAGVNTGALKICAYPGPIGGNAPEIPTYTGSAFYFGQDSADAGETGSSPGVTNPLDGSAGMNHYVQFSGLKIAPTSNTNSAWLFNIDNSAHYFRSFNCECTWPFSADMRAGGAAGDGIGVRIFLPYIHDLGGATQTHGVYADAEAGYAWDWEIAYGFISHCYSGSSIQSYAAGYGGSGADLQGHTSNGAILVHHMCIDATTGAGTGNKYGVYWSNYTAGTSGSPNVACYNLICNAGDSSIGFNTNGGGAGEAIYIYNYNNTCYAINGTQGMVYNGWSPVSPSVALLQNNVFILGAGRGTNTIPYWNNGGSGPFTFTDNQCWDPEGHVTSTGMGGTGNNYGDPLVTTDWTNFELTGSSPCLGSGSTASLPILFPYDYMLGVAPRNGQSMIQRGAFA